MARKKSSWIGPQNPVDTSTGLIKPVAEMNSEQKTEAAKMDPRPIIVPKEKSENTLKKVKQLDPRTGAAIDVPTELRPYKAPVVKREKPKVATTQKLNRAGLRAPKRGELKRGITAVSTDPKKRRVKKQTPIVVKPGQAGKLDGKIVRVTPENLTQVYDQKRRTELPAVQAPGPEKPRTLAPGAGARRENVFVDPRKASGEQATRRLKGLSVPHKMIAPAVNQAMEHLRGMAATKGTPEYHEHVAGFNAIHPTILGMDSTIHHALGAMAHHTMYPKQDSHSVITQITAAIGDRLSEGRSMEVQRAQRQRGNTNGS